MSRMFALSPRREPRAEAQRSGTRGVGGTFCGTCCASPVRVTATACLIAHLDVVGTRLPLDKVHSGHESTASPTAHWRTSRQVREQTVRRHHSTGTSHLKPPSQPDNARVPTFFIFCSL